MAPAGEGSSKSPQPALFPTAQKTGQKRRQVKNACTKCQKSSKGCDSGRPCRRCVRYGFGVEECVDSPRKERQKGAKRGPYKKRNAIAIPLPAGVDQSAGVEPMSYAYSTFYAGPGPGPVPQGEACYPGWLPTVMEPPSNPSFSTSQPMFPTTVPTPTHGTVPYDAYGGFAQYMKPPPLPGPFDDYGAQQSRRRPPHM